MAGIFGKYAMWKLCRSFPHGLEENLFSTGCFFFSTKDAENYRLELMLVLISLTVSAKAGSFFIFFSTCWME